MDILGGLIAIGKKPNQQPTVAAKVTKKEEVVPLEEFFTQFILPPFLIDRAFQHQKEGVRWLHDRYKAQAGGILADDMGLGKTYQVICLLAGLMSMNCIERVLIIAPVAVLRSWQRELNEHLKPYVSRSTQITVINSEMGKPKRQSILRDAFRSDTPFKYKHIIVSSYHLVSNMVDDFSQSHWDYVILDEGHVIKNPQTKITESMHCLRSQHRLLLSGTPIQNNLDEFWCVVNWVTKGAIFGSQANFRRSISNPIKAGQDPTATPEIRAVSEEAVRILTALTRPIFLQRKKSEQPAEALRLPEKIELVMWIPLASKQRRLYEEFLRSRQVASALTRSTYPVELITHLKSLCRHPFLLEAYETNKRRKAEQELAKSASKSRPAGKQTGTRRDDDDDDFESLTAGLGSLKLGTDKAAPEDDDFPLDKLTSSANIFDIAARSPDVHELYQGSVKLRILAKLAYRLTREGHRLLIFSQSRMMCDLIQRVLAEYGLPTHRVDGSVSGDARQRIIDEFNDLSEDVHGPSICLLTTRACGVGITLTGADRVIIFDPSWNPAEDRQAVDRAYRIGQTRNVVVYRMICASTVEEKMYEKQVFKDGLRVVSESGDTTSARYFSNEETSALFTLGPPARSLVMEKMWALAGQEMRTFPDTRGELASALGFTRHDALYSVKKDDSLDCARNGDEEGKGRFVPKGTINNFPEVGKRRQAPKDAMVKEPGSFIKPLIEIDLTGDSPSPPPLKPRVLQEISLNDRDHGPSTDTKKSPLKPNVARNICYIDVEEAMDEIGKKREQEEKEEQDYAERDDYCVEGEAEKSEIPNKSGKDILGEGALEEKRQEGEAVAVEPESERALDGGEEELEEDKPLDAVIDRLDGNYGADGEMDDPKHTNRPDFSPNPLSTQRGDSKRNSFFGTPTSQIVDNMSIFDTLQIQAFSTVKKPKFGGIIESSDEEEQEDEDEAGDYDENEAKGEDNECEEEEEYSESCLPLSEQDVLVPPDEPTSYTVLPPTPFNPSEHSGAFDGTPVEPLVEPLAEPVFDLVLPESPAHAVEPDETNQASDSPLVDTSETPAAETRASLAPSGKPRFDHFKKIAIPVLVHESDDASSFSRPRSAYDDKTLAFLDTHRLHHVQLPACRTAWSLLPADITLYNDLNAEARGHERRKAYEESCRLYLQALDLYDGELLLHGKLAWLSTKLQVECDEEYLLELQG